MKPGATLGERFEGWFCTPIDKLKECPEGDGVFLAMSAALFLCERFYRTQTNTHEGQGGNLAFQEAAAADFGIDLEKFEIFWKVFRHGIQHQGMPKKLTDETGMSYTWRIDSAYPALPTFVTASARTIEIRIDPWKFADLIKNKYRSNPSVLQNAVTHAFGEVQ